MGRRRRGAPAPMEQAIQAAVVHHWRMLGLPGTLVAAIPNQYAHGQPGLTRGLADLLVIAPGLPVAFIELKRDEDSPISDEQREFGKLCMALGIRYAICIGRDEPITMLEAWSAVRRAAA
jgi:hypothetical protein